MSEPTYHELREHNDSLQRGHARLMTDYITEQRRADRYRDEAHLLTKERDEAVAANRRLLSEVARLEGALRFYADPESWGWTVSDPSFRQGWRTVTRPLAVADLGEKARAALSPSLLRPRGDEGVPLAHAIGGPSANRAPVPDAATPPTDAKGEA